MSLFGAGCGCFIESGSVVLDGKCKRAAVKTSGDLDFRGSAVPDGVDGEFPDYLEDFVRRAF